MSPIEQTLEALGLLPVDGVATCPQCDRPSLVVADRTCSGGCSRQEIGAAFDRLAGLAASETLRMLASVSADEFRASPPKIPVAISPGAPWPCALDSAYYGPLGEAARAIEPLTEADPMAVLVQLIVAFGNAVGRGPRVVLGSTRQWANLFTVIVGKSSKSRKGTSWQNALEIIGGVDQAWVSDRIKSGLSSGEGVIHAVRDPLVVREPIREGGKRTGRIVDYQEVEQDAGEADKRLLVVEGEFARVLKVAARKENVLSAVLRDAWDTGKLGSLTRSPYKATGTHVSVIGHITRDELRRELSACDSFNGFANRFLWVCARRSKELPFGERGIGDAASGLIDRLAKAVRDARARGDDYVLTMDPQCRELWRNTYSRLSADLPGLVGAILGRAEAQTLRLALIFALADGSDMIRTPHLEAGLAVWRYSEQSARAIFGDAIGDSVGDEILRVLRDSPEGMTRDELRNHFDRHVPAGRMTQALRALAEHDLVRGQKERPEGGRGRSAERWFALPAQRAESAGSAETYRVPGNNRANRAQEEDHNQVAAQPGDSEEPEDDVDFLPVESALG